MSAQLDRLLAHWRAEPTIGANIQFWHREDARKALTDPLPDNMHPRLRKAFHTLGYQALFRHQRQAWEHAQAGENLVVVTGTASGKTLCYNLPVLDAALRDPEARALYLFPTKALAHDQADELQRWLTAMGAAADIPQANFDGDTKSGQRVQIRKKARIVFTNPDMLHLGILPYHARWVEYSPICAISCWTRCIVIGGCSDHTWLISCVD